jgi:PPK2 family polyphosphate:nucleotide phosphotransferase
MDPRLRFGNDLIAPLRVHPGRSVVLGRDFDPGHVDGLSRVEAEDMLGRGVELLAEYQDRLAAQATTGMLFVLQGMDGSGKDSTIKHVMSGVNPQGVEVHSFKQPSIEERQHDFLWRHQRVLPARGRIGIFNRSHYEEVLVARVHPDLVAPESGPAEGAPTESAPTEGGPAEGRPPAAGEKAEPHSGELWKSRYRAINDWERHLVDSGTLVAKVFLNVSRTEQAERFLARIERPEKNWKFSPSDVQERRSWDDYQVAISEMLSRTSTDWAPWYVVPADHKWFARLASAAVLVHTLAAIDPQYPTIDDATREKMAQARAGLRAELGRSKGRGGGG